MEYKYKIIDTHAHYDDEQFDEDRAKLLEELKEEDMTVVNHSLLAKWPYKDEKPIENLVVDEAHNLVEKGYDFFASEIEYRGMRYFLQEIYPAELILSSPFAYQMKGKRVIKPLDRFYYYIKLEADNKKKISDLVQFIYKIFVDYYSGICCHR